MKKTTIETNAGKIPKRLESEQPDTKTEKIAEKNKRNEPDYYQMLRWMSRVDKIKFYDADETNYFFPNL